MATTWTLPVQDILTDALEIIGVIGVGQTANANDHAKALTALQNILKELPLHGVSWPKVTVAPVSLSWSAGTPSKVTLPTDYFGVPNFYYLNSDGGKIDLEVMTKARYDSITNPAQTAEYPTSVYVGADGSATLWPVPTANPNLKLTYQAIVSDAAVASSPDVAQTWLAGLALWVANELAPKFGVSLQERADIERRFMMRRQLMLAYACETAPIAFTVAD